MSAALRGVLGGLLAGLLFSCAGIVGGGTSQARMYGLLIVTPAMLLIGALIGLVVGVAVGLVLGRRGLHWSLGALSGLVLGAAIGGAFDWAVHREIDLQHGMLIITAWVGLLAGGNAARNPTRDVVHVK